MNQKYKSLRELDAMIACAIFDYKLVSMPDKNDRGLDLWEVKSPDGTVYNTYPKSWERDYGLRNYSTSLENAFIVVWKMEQKAHEV